MTPLVCTLLKRDQTSLHSKLPKAADIFVFDRLLGVAHVDRTKGPPRNRSDPTWVASLPPIYRSLKPLPAENREKVWNSSCSFPAQSLKKSREARDLISKMRSCTLRSDLENKAFSAVFCLFLRSDLAMQDRILEIRSLASLGKESREGRKVPEKSPKSVISEAFRGLFGTFWRPWAGRPRIACLRTCYRARESLNPRNTKKLPKYRCSRNNYRIIRCVQFRNCLQWGRSNLVDPAGSPKIHLLNQDFGNILSIFPRKNSKTQSSLNFL